MTFYHSSMTDRELIRAAESMENPFTRFLSGRLATRADQLREVQALADVSPDLPPTGDDCLDRLESIAAIVARD
jgi:hypothetical protein